ncbi:MAG: glycerol-3-phosphate acyltransferase [Candidatus Brocadiaceae bacterium]
MLIYNIIGPVVSYFIGSIPFGFLIAKLVKGIDIRQVGSGNPALPMCQGRWEDLTVYWFFFWIC